MTPGWARYDPSSGASSTSAEDLAEVRRARVLSSTEGALGERKAVIFRQSPSAMTSGVAASGAWCVRVTPAARWTNGLMGWMSSSDTVTQAFGNLRFDSAEQASFFCERAGWAHEVEQPHATPAPIAADPDATTTRGTAGNQYAFVIHPLAVQTALKRDGPRRARHQYAHPSRPSATGVSTWANTRHTGYGSDPWRPRKDIAQAADAWTGPGWAAPRPIAPDADAGSSSGGSGAH